MVSSKEAVEPLAAGQDAVEPPNATILFRSFSSIEEPMVQKWIRFRNGIVADAPVSLQAARAARPAVPGEPATHGPAESGGGVLYWRLVASNNRELGRSAFLYQSVEQARRHVARIVAAVDEIRIEAVADRPSARRGWVLSLDAHPVLTSARWYSSSSTSAASAASALAALRGARVLISPLTHPGSRRRAAGRATMAG